MPIEGERDPQALSETCEGCAMIEGDRGERVACETYDGGVMRS